MSTQNDDQPIRILHLSDIYFNAEKAWDEDPVLHSLIRSIKTEAQAGLVPDLVAITGDLAFAGIADEYELARNWLENEPWPALPQDFPHDRLLLAPGNYGCRSLPNRFGRSTYSRRSAVLVSRKFSPRKTLTALPESSMNSPELPAFEHLGSPRRIHAEVRISRAGELSKCLFPSRSWLLFAAVVLSFLAAPEMIGVTSMCRFWLGDERVYHRLLHFFRSKAYDPHHLSVDSKKRLPRIL